MAVFFAGVLSLCAALGMGRLGVVALDDQDRRCSASTPANWTGEHLRKLAAEAVAAHAAADAADDELFGAGKRGDEVPSDAWSPRSRDERIAAALRSLREARKPPRRAGTRGQLLPGEGEAGVRGPGRGPAAADVAAAQLLLDQATAAQQAKFKRLAAAQRGEDRLRLAGGCAAAPSRPPAMSWSGAPGRRRAAQARAAAAQRKAAERQKNSTGPGPVRNITDPGSRLMPVRGGGFIQGYNAQLVTSEDGLIIAATLTQDTGDTTWLKPMMAAAEAAAAVITARRPAGPDTASPDTGSSDSSGGDDGSAACRTAGYQPPAGDGEPGYAGRSACSSPTPATAPKPTSLPSGRPASSRPASAATWNTRPAPPATTTTSLPGRTPPP